MGVTQQLPSEDRYFLSKEYAKAKIAIMLAGRAAEEILLDQQTTGAGNDLEQATDIARKMVMQWGMSEALGPLAFGTREEAIFIGREIAQHQEYSEQTAITIDSEVRRLVVEGHEKAKDLITQHRPTLERLAMALLEYESLDTADIESIVDGGTLPSRPLLASASGFETEEAPDKHEVTDKAGILAPEPEKA
jgi:cell division protease FtsH